MMMTMESDRKILQQFLLPTCDFSIVSYTKPLLLCVLQGDNLIRISTMRNSNLKGRDTCKRIVMVLRYHYNFHVVLFIMLYKVVLTFKFVDEP